MRPTILLANCLNINDTTELLELHYDDLDFEQGPAPYNYLKLKYPIHSVHPTQCLSVDPKTRQLEFNVNTDYFDFEANTRRTLNPKFDANRVDDAGPLFIDISTRRSRARYMIHYKLMQVKNYVLLLIVKD